MSIRFVNFIFTNNLLLIFLIGATHQVSISPKLDFVEETRNDPVPAKIQGVRVIVEANQLNDDNSEAVFVKTSGGKQTIGVHTDITFDVTGNKTDGTKAEADNDSGEVPIFLGTDVEHGRTKFERVNPNLNQPNFYATNDDTIGFAGGEAGTWVRLFPSANGWTTEKYPPSTRKYKNGGNPGFIPYSINHKSLMPCMCPNVQTPWHRVDITPSRPRAHSVDNKLEKPFE